MAAPNPRKTVTINTELNTIGKARTKKQSAASGQQTAQEYNNARNESRASRGSEPPNMTTIYNKFATEHYNPEDDDGLNGKYGGKRTRKRRTNKRRTNKRRTNKRRTNKRRKYRR
jgi:hypothetical protein